MDCVIEIDTEDSDKFECCNIKIRTARKKYECCECHAEISPGNDYEYVRGLCTGDWLSYKTCMPCLEVRDTFLCSYYYEQIWDHLGESEIEPDMSALMQLSGEAQRKMIEMMVLNNF